MIFGSDSVDGTFEHSLSRYNHLNNALHCLYHRAAHNKLSACSGLLLSQQIDSARLRIIVCSVQGGQ